MGFFQNIKQKLTESTGAKIATAVLAVALIGGGVAGIVYAVTASNPEAAVGKAVVATFTGKERAGEEVFGLGALAKAMAEQGSELTVEAELNEVPIDIGITSLNLPNVGAKAVVRSNPDKESNVEVEVKLAGTSLITAKAYGDSKQVQVKVPKLSSATLALNYGSETLKEDIRNSYLVEYAGIPEETLETVLEHLPEKTTQQDNLQSYAKLAEQLIAATKNNFTELKLEKAGKTELTIREELLECRKYTLVIPKAQLSGFLYDATEAVKSYVEELAGEVNLDETEVSYLFLTVDKLVRELRGYLTDMTVEFYISENRLVKLTADWGMEWLLDAPEPGKLVLEFAPEGHPLDNMTLALALPIHQGIDMEDIPERIDLDYTVVTDNTEDAYAAEYKVVCNEIPAKLAITYEKLGGEFELFADAGEISLTLQGVISQLEKGKKVSAEVENYIYTEEDYVEEADIQVSLLAQVLEGTIEPLDEAALDVLQMQEAEFQALEEEIEGNILKMAFSLMGLFQ